MRHASTSPWMNYEEASAYTGYSVRYLQNPVSAGRIPVYGNPRVRRFRRDMGAPNSSNVVNEPSGTRRALRRTHYRPAPVHTDAGAPLGQKSLTAMGESHGR
jgi:hypothetical protein